MFEFIESARRARLMRGPAPWAACALALILLAGCGKREVEVTSPRRGEIHESFTEPARTRLANVYRIAMPVAGRVGRITLEPGDQVRQGQTLAAIDRTPLEQSVIEAKAVVAELEASLRVQDDHRLEETAKVEVEASISAALESLKASNAQVKAEQARAERAVKERGRFEKLVKDNAVTQSKLDDAVLVAETAVIELRKQEFYRSAMNFMIVAIRLGPKYIDQWLARKALQRETYLQQLIQARARLARAEHQLGLVRLESPIDGVVLERYERGDAPLAAGQPLLLLGHLAELEVVADVLTQDALRLRPGSRVELAPAARLAPLAGTVKRIEPAGFTKLSSLGVEQQRVNVIVSLDGPTSGTDGPTSELGVGYRLQARFFTGQQGDALILPRFSVLQAPNGTFYVFKVEGGKLARQPVELGLRSDLELEVTGGLAEADTIVATPDTVMAAGETVKVLTKKE